MGQVSWKPLLERAAEIVRSYESGVTLRQLFYVLVSEGELPNTQNYYSSLSDYTAEARRGEPPFERGAARAFCEEHGPFPPLVDNTREISRPASWEGPGTALRSLADQYRRDRLRRFDHSLYIAVEKNTVENVAAPWFEDRGVPIFALRGYGSQTFVDHVADQIERDPRPAVVIYAGDLDPTGIDIARDLRERTGNIDTFERVAVTPEQIEEFDLSKNPAPERDTRNESFRDRYGELFQVEVEAINPDRLREVFEDALEPYWQEDEYQAVLEREEAERGRLQVLAERV